MEYWLQLSSVSHPLDRCSYETQTLFKTDCPEAIILELDTYSDLFLVQQYTTLLQSAQSFHLHIEVCDWKDGGSVTRMIQSLYRLAKPDCITWHGATQADLIRFITPLGEIHQLETPKKITDYIK
ncbi:MAG: hypothetical protein U0U66_10340 [Cytophagaceae bacterium]